ncbi:PEP-CTERM sorting domain-containing protein [Hankyongella ginsenosidimutans]|uniref:PEP-CTERM sorting domain-containing protein n=1 Tax=Hankyongella ginsenosidimutans TaxID=1763828 RepID=A0A4D7CBG8_9SPHN|nr:PEP-CTERM sorting domain-containing protein [Hankyongella ginsenosidimutans]QCI79576.1 PEP-CTERM sorting domain-containing protein [Hankyongella ginsenosidimutans]
MKFDLFKTVAIAAIALAAGSANAAVSGSLLFDQTPSSPLTGIASDDGAAFSQYEAADNFSVATTSQLTGLVFWGNRLSQQTLDNFTVRIYADDPSFPGAPSISPLFTANLGEITGVNTVVFDDAGVQVLRYEADALSGPILTAGEQYWISIVNTLGVQNDDFFWSFGPFGADGFNAGRSLLGAPVDFDVFADGDYAFQVYGTQVPEPGSIALLGAGLALAGFARRKRA